MYIILKDPLWSKYETYFYDLFRYDSHSSNEDMKTPRINSEYDMLHIHLSLGLTYFKNHRQLPLLDKVLPKWMAIILALEDSCKGH